jgi:integrase/recombinase XerD
MKLVQTVTQYITLKQSLGFRFQSERIILKTFCRTMGKIHMDQVKPVAVRAFLDGHGPVTRHWSRKWETLRGFYGFALARGWARRSPLPTEAPKVAMIFTPYIYSMPELQRLLQAISPEHTRSLSPLTMRVLLLLLYGAGLRLSEALKLEDADVDVKDALLHVRCSKFFKSRLVPVGPKLAGVLADYARQRPAGGVSHHRFFRSNTGAPVNCFTVQRVFQALRLAADVKRTDGSRYQPRLHDLRHTAAVHRLVAGYREGADLQMLLVQLSTYLGHVSLAGTQKYLTMTPELREQASARFACYALGGSHE